MQKWLESEPDNIFANYKLGTTLCELKSYEISLPYLETTFKLLTKSNDRESYPFLGVFIEYYCNLCYNVGDKDKAAQIKYEVMNW
jgi:hypothetical protein